MVLRCEFCDELTVPQVELQAIVYVLVNLTLLCAPCRTTDQGRAQLGKKRVNLRFMAMLLASDGEKGSAAECFVDLNPTQSRRRRSRRVNKLMHICGNVWLLIALPTTLPRRVNYLSR